MRRLLRGLGLLVLVVSSLAWATPTAARAQDDEPAPEAGSEETTERPAVEATLEVIDQSLSVAADGVFVVDLRWTGPWVEDYFVSATVFAPLGDEDEVDDPPGDAVNRYPSAANPLRLSSVERIAGDTFRFELPIRSFSANDDRVWLREAGVYPVSIEVRDSGGALASTRTHLIHRSGDSAELDGLDIAIVLDVSAADGIELAEAVQLLTEHPSLPILTVLESGVLTQLAGDPDLSAALAAALGDRPVTGEPTLGLDPSALASIGHGDLYAGELDQFWNRFDLVGLEPDRTVLALSDAITEEGATLLAGQGIDVVIDLSAGDTSGSIHTSAAGLTVIAVDQESTSALRRSPNAVLQAHELLARLTVRRDTSAAPVIIGGPEVRLVSLEALDVLFDALEQPGALVPVPFDIAVRNSPDLPSALPTSADHRLDDVAARVTEVRDLLALYADFHQSGAPTPAQVERALLSSLSVDRNAADRAADLDRVVADLEASFDVITLPPRQSINLAARNRAIPLSITNDAGGDRRVLLRFRSDRVEVAQHDTVVTIPAGSSSIEIDVLARSLGVSPLDVEVLTPDGARVLATTRFHIRSTAVPGLGYLLSGAALVFLIAWWIVSFTRTRALAAMPVPDGGDAERSAPGDPRDDRAAAATASTAVDDPTTPRSGDPLDHDAETAERQAPTR